MSVTDPRERVALSLGPLPGEESAYWGTLAGWRDWSAWAPPAPRVEGYGPLKKQASWRSRVDAMSASLAEDAEAAGT